MLVYKPSSPACLLEPHFPLWSQVHTYVFRTMLSSCQSVFYQFDLLAPVIEPRKVKGKKIFFPLCIETTPLFPESVRGPGLLNDWFSQIGFICWSFLVYLRWYNFLFWIFSQVVCYYKPQVIWADYFVLCAFWISACIDFNNSPKMKTI